MPNSLNKDVSFGDKHRIDRRWDQDPAIPSNLNKLMRSTQPQKLARNRKGKLVDARTGERIYYCLHIDLSGAANDPKEPGKAEIRVPGQTFKMKCGTEYMVMPSGSIRRLSPKKGD
jgi:hypothetical protein